VDTSIDEIAICIDAYLICGGFHHAVL